MDFLLEIGCEEIPARMLPPAQESLSDLFRQACEKNALADSPAIRALGTPRRLTLLVSGLNAAQADRQEEILGPRLEAAYDGEGKPTRACEGFLKSRSASLTDLVQIKTARGTVVGLRRMIPGKTALEVLAQAVPDILGRLTFPKSMRWGEGTFAFVRPIHWIVCLLEREVVPFAFAGISSGRTTRGHRLSGSGIEIGHPSEYIERLRAHDVIVAAEERRAIIERQSRRLAESVNAVLVPDPGLMAEVTNLVEFPVPVLGRFDESFLQVPRPVLVAAMRNHQRYFALEDSAGRLQNAFVAVANTPVRDERVVRHGNERVLGARLSDARFFFEHDLQTPLTERVSRLQDMVFQADLGSYYEKSIRVANLALWLAWKMGLGAWEKMNRAIEILTFAPENLHTDGEKFSWRVARAAILCKADLLTDMVGEFPELQGEMGAEYARRGGEPPAVAQAIEEHYRPRVSGGRLPESAEGAILALADKLDTLAGCFGVGLKPTGTADPYALRRACLGVLAILLERDIHISLREILLHAVRGVSDRIRVYQERRAQEKARRAARRKGAKTAEPEAEKTEEFSEDALVRELYEFFGGRLRQRFLEEAPADRVEAVLAGGFDDPAAALSRLRGVCAVAAEPSFGDLVVAFRRVSRILDGFEGDGFDPTLLQAEEEKRLFEVVSEIEPVFEKHIGAHRYREALDLLAQRLRAPVDAFFEKILVNDPANARGSNNRKALLSRINGMFTRVADFARLQVRDGETQRTARDGEPA
jgi:glycyl-tRNA synthetase beta chain